MMNKYLSFEKSRKLAELGYKPDDDKKYWIYPCTQEAEWMLIDKGCDMDSTNFLWQVKGEHFPAPDCHDLLMELAKQDKENPDFKLFTVIDTDDNLVFVYGYDWLVTDINPVEALGAALIKLLEEKQNGN